MCGSSTFSSELARYFCPKLGFQNFGNMLFVHLDALWHHLLSSTQA